jgi:DNA-binding response OmpR family regulator
MLRRSQITKEATAASVEVIRLGKLEIDLAARSVKIGAIVTDLTPREYDLLLMLAHHPGRTFSRDYLLERIWGTSFEGSDRVVDTTVVRLRRKLLEEGERVVSVWGVGYRLDA